MRLQLRRFCLLLMTLAAVITNTEAQQDTRVTTWRGILRHPADWYGTAEALRIADNVLVYQNENGGWSKNIDMARVLDGSEKAKILEEARTASTTIDNGATFTQVRYLARVFQTTPSQRLKDSILRGIDYLLEAQYPNGGWPQFYPIRRGYYEHITYNDGAMIGVMNLLRDVALGVEPYTFADQPRRDRAASAIRKGLEIILRTQIKVDGTLTAWCAQHDRETLLPAKARAYELPSISGSESVGVVRYLMSIDNPDTRVIRAVKSAVAWFERSRLLGIALVRKEDPALPKGYDLVVVEDPDAPPLWARFYEIETNRPIFVGRDSKTKYSLAEIEHERRTGYSYLRGYAESLMSKEYPVWAEKWHVR